MRLPLPDLCDAFPEKVRVAAPLLRNFGGYDAFHGGISTIKCFEDNSLVAERLEENGHGRVLVVDAGGLVAPDRPGELHIPGGDRHAVPRP